MNHEVASVAECLLALIAGERSLTGMTSQMHSKGTSPTELLATFGAHERLLTRMTPQMQNRVIFPPEFHVTLDTRERFPIRVDLIMFSQSARMNEVSSANIT